MRSPSSRRSRFTAVLRFAAAAGLAAAALGFAAPRASAETIYETDDPFGGFFGLIGFDVFESQSVGIRFTPAARYSLDSVGVWFMNNDFSGTIFDTVTLTVRDDGVSGTGASIPGNTIYESFSFQITAVGWDPQLETVQSVTHPVLEAGVNYWIVCESNALAGTDPVWNWPGIGSGYTATTDGSTGQWQDGGEGATATAIIQGTRLFTLAGNSPVPVGGVLTLQANGARPDMRLFFVASLATGSTPVPTLGVTLGLAFPRLLGRPVRTNENGDAGLLFTIPPRAAGRVVYTQAAQITAISNVETITILP